MKQLDFSQPGKMPLTQDRLAFLQSAYTEVLAAIVAAGGGVTANIPVVISGCVVTGTGTINITEGWILYNNEIIYCPAQSVMPPGGNVAKMAKSASANPLLYYDGSTPNVILDATWSLGYFTAGVNSAGAFYLDTLQPYGVNFGIANREQAFTSIDISTSPSLGGVTGTIYFKKDFTTNTLQIRGVLTANNAQNFNASPSAHYYAMCSLPAAYVPATNAYFTAHYYLAGQILDDLNVSWIKQLTAFVNDVGEVTINWIKPDVAITSYTVMFNAIIPLE